MPKLSDRSQQIPSSPIRKLQKYADLAKSSGRKVFQLNIGQPDIKSPPQLQDTLKQISSTNLPYTKSEGTDALRKQIANYYETINLPISSEEIIVTTGASEAIFFAINSITDPGDEIIIPEPFYANYLSFSYAQNVNIKPILSTIEDNFSLPNIADFEKIITPKTRAVLICNPNNPTGYLYSKEEVKKLCTIAVKYNIFLIVDEVYREFVYQEKEHYSVLNETAVSDNVIVIDSFSKRFSLCGSRIGYLISKNKAILTSVLKLAQARLSVPYVEQLVCEKILKESQTAYFDEIIKEYDERRQTLISELKKIPNVRVSVPLGAFYCIVKLPVDNAEKFAIWLLKEFHIDNETVMLAPAEGFYFTKTKGLKEIRIAYVLKKKSLIRSVQIIKKALQTYNAC